VSEDEFALRLELGGLLGREEDNSGATEGKRENGALGVLGECFEERKKEVVL
jgi:hypothetical protein